jgi:hypothetical protein
VIIHLLAGLLVAGRLAADDSAGVEFFEKHVRPVLVQHCYECHSQQSSDLGGGLRLDSQPGWMTGGNRGPAIVPGDVAGSRLIQAIRFLDEDLQMPPDGPLPAELVGYLERWVAIGAPDPRTNNDATSGPGVGHPSDPEAGRGHWAYRPLVRSTPPATTHNSSARTTIDRFVLERLAAAGLEPVADTEPRQLVRRLYFQLIGLPPTPDQVADFIEDSSPGARERLVDRLLASPRFGERWGRHWLDLARYADSNGLDENFLFREAWRYRNWVIAAVNHDLPFDRFTTEQLAGDLLPYDSLDQRDGQRIAAGFLVVGPKVLLGNEEQRQRLEVADEQLDTIGRTFLGQTLGCARCHDHKFDPIPTADYYALAGIFTSTQVMEMRYMLGEQRLMERLVGLGKQGAALDEAYEQFWREAPQLRKRLEHARSGLEALQQENTEAWQKIVQDHADAVAQPATDVAQTHAERVAAQQALVDQLESKLAQPPAIPPRAMVPGERETVGDESIRLAGQADRPGSKVSRGFLRVLSANEDSTISPSQSGRLELCHWLTDIDHGAGHLTARVLANRIWHHLIGRGLVGTVDNFGRTGELPTHPELLDHLALYLVDNDWSVKALVREIVLSRTFALSSCGNERGEQVDPDNRLLWRAHRRRLDPESLRDAMLAISGTLDTRPMESSVWYLGDQATGVGENVRRRTDFAARSVYLPVIRNDLPELYEAFDFANPHATTGARPQTMGAGQALFLLNSDLVANCATALARRLLSSVGDPPAADDPARLDQLFRQILNEAPSDEERRVLLGLLEEARQRSGESGSPDVEQQAWAEVCHVLFATSRFQFVE